MSSVLGREEVATPGEQATNAHRILRHFVATHGAITFFDPPADRTRAAIIGAIERFSFGSFPLAIARQAMPEIPAIQKQEAETIRQALVLSLVRRHGVQIAPMQRFQFRSLLLLSTLDQFT
jgi:hypothetical protein